MCTKWHGFLYMLFPEKKMLKVFIFWRKSILLLLLMIWCWP
uniref:Uncharacterized protein n=1 Tax=Rhizophora mucronata TaxID=61149 RepID=A0A2P2P805_RHIMU